MRPLEKDSRPSFRELSDSRGPQRSSMDRTRAMRPPELSSLLDAVDDESRDAAWAQLLGRFSRLLLHTVHARSDAYDSAMDRYVFVLQKLREDEYRRLRRFAAGGRGEFSTWLVGECANRVPVQVASRGICTTCGSGGDMAQSQG